MDKILKLKLVLIFILLLVAVFNYELHFIKSTEAIHTYDQVTFMVATICFGVIAGTSIYNFALFAYMKSRQHIYYALAQLFTLMFLINLDSLFIKPFDEIFGLKSLFLFYLIFRKCLCSFSPYCLSKSFYAPIMAVDYMS